MCNGFNISKSGFYARLKDATSKRMLANLKLLLEIN